MLFRLFDRQTIYVQECTNPVNHHKRPSKINDSRKRKISPKQQRFHLLRHNWFPTVISRRAKAEGVGVGYYDCVRKGRLTARARKTRGIIKLVK